MLVAWCQGAEAACCVSVLLYRKVGLREPMQQLATTLGWLRRVKILLERPDSRLAGGGHIVIEG